MRHFVNPIANGGAPIYMDDFITVDDENKKAYEAILAGLDTKIILSGCEVSNLNTIATTFDVSAGFVYLNGEVMEVDAYSGSYPIYIHEAASVDTDRDFEDGNTDPVLTLRKAEFTATPSGDNIELSPTSGYYLDTVVRRASYAVGDIRMMTVLTDLFDGTGLGTDTSVERGFALCNGNNGTPDLSGKFIVGYSESVGDYDTIGNTGGEEEHQLTQAELPDYTIPYTINKEQNGTLGVSGSFASTQLGLNDASANLAISSGGSDQPHENRPPYYVLAYVMKVS